MVVADLMNIQSDHGHQPAFADARLNPHKQNGMGSKEDKPIEHWALFADYNFRFWPDLPSQIAPDGSPFARFSDQQGKRFSP